MIIGRKHWLNSLKKNWKPVRNYTGWERSKTVGLIVPYVNADDYKVVQAQVDKWHHEGKQVYVLRLSELKMNKKRESIREHNVLYANETNWKGIPESPDFNDFSSQKFDVVLQLCTQEFKALDFVPYLVHTGLLVGPVVLDSEPYDVQIQVKGRSWKEVFSEVENWLKKINYVA